MNKNLDKTNTPVNRSPKAEYIQMSLFDNGNGFPFDPYVKVPKRKKTTKRNKRR